MRSCPRGGFRGVESEFEVQNGLQEAPGMKMNEFMRFTNFQNFNEKSINQVFSVVERNCREFSLRENNQSSDASRTAQGSK